MSDQTLKKSKNESSGICRVCVGPDSPQNSESAQDNNNSRSEALAKYSGSSWIKTVEASEAKEDPELKQWYEKVGNKDDTVDNIMKVHSLNLTTLSDHFSMYTHVMHDPSPLSRAEREMCATMVSFCNNCNYCLTHHSAGLKKLLGEDRAACVEELKQGKITDLLSTREQALVTYSQKLTLTPQKITKEDFDMLKKEDLTDRAILDLVQCIGYFNYVNRLANGLGVVPGINEGEMGSWPPEVPEGKE